MNNSPSPDQPRLLYWIGLAALLVAIQAVFTLTEANGDPSQSNSWRRTRFGWEQADSLPIKAVSSLYSQAGEDAKKYQAGQVQATSTKRLYRLHSILLPMGIAGS